MPEGEGNLILLPRYAGWWKRLDVAFSQGSVKPGMKIRPYLDRSRHYYGLNYTDTIRNILYDQYSGRPYIEIEPGRHFYTETSFPFYEVSLDGTAQTRPEDY